MFPCRDSFAKWKIPKSGKSKIKVKLSEPETSWVGNDPVIHRACLGQEGEEMGVLYNVNVQKYEEQRNKKGSGGPSQILERFHMHLVTSCPSHILFCFCLFFFFLFPNFFLVWCGKKVGKWVKVSFFLFYFIFYCKQSLSLSLSLHIYMYVEIGFYFRILRKFCSIEQEKHF